MEPDPDTLTMEKTRPLISVRDNTEYHMFDKIEKVTAEGKDQSVTVRHNTPTFGVIRDVYKKRLKAETETTEYRQYMQRLATVLTVVVWSGPPNFKLNGVWLPRGVKQQWHFKFSKTFLSASDLLKVSSSLSLRLSDLANGGGVWFWKGGEDCLPRTRTLDQWQHSSSFLF